MALLLIALVMTASTSLYALHLVEVESSKISQYKGRADRLSEFADL